MIKEEIMCVCERERGGERQRQRRQREYNTIKIFQTKCYYIPYDILFSKLKLYKKNDKFGFISH